MSVQYENKSGPIWTDEQIQELRRVAVQGALKTGIDMPGAEEAAQEAMITMCGPGGKLIGNPRGYARICGKNEALDVLRNNQRRPKLSLDLLVEEEGFDRPDKDPLADPETVAQRNEQSFKIQTAINKLSKDHRAVIVGRYYLGFGSTRLAERLGVKVGTVKSRLHRAEGNLRRILLQT